MPLSPVVDVLFAHRIYVVFAPFIVIRLLSCLVHIYRGRQSVDLGVLAFLAADSAQVGNTKRYFSQASPAYPLRPTASARTIGCLFLTS